MGDGPRTIPGARQRVGCSFPSRVLVSSTLEPHREDSVNRQFHRKLRLWLIAVSALLSGTACVSTRQDAPEWYLAPPAVEQGLTGAGSFRAATREGARAGADTAGCKEIARNLSQRLEQLVRVWLGEHQGEAPPDARVALGDAARAVATRYPTGCQELKREERRFEDGSWISFSLQSIGPTGAIAAFKAARDAEPTLRRTALSWELLDREIAQQLQPPAK